MDDWAAEAAARRALGLADRLGLAGELKDDAAVLMAGKEDLEGDRRRELVSRIATGDWDAVVITHSSFERIRMSPAFAKTSSSISRIRPFNDFLSLTNLSSLIKSSIVHRSERMSDSFSCADGIFGISSK